MLLRSHWPHRGRFWSHKRTVSRCESQRVEEDRLTLVLRQRQTSQALDGLPENPITCKFETKSYTRNVPIRRLASSARGWQMRYGPMCIAQEGCWICEKQKVRIFSLAIFKSCRCVLRCDIATTTIMLLILRLIPCLPSTVPIEFEQFFSYMY